MTHVRYIKIIKNMCIFKSGGAHKVAKSDLQKNNLCLYNLFVGVCKHFDMCSGALEYNEAIQRLSQNVKNSSYFQN